MERSGYDRRKRPFAELPSDHHKSREFDDPRPQNHFQSISHQSSIREQTPNAENFRGYTTPVQEYRSPRTPDTPYIGAPRYTPYDAPTPYLKSITNDHRIRPRYMREPQPQDNPFTPNVSWQYDLPQDTSQVREEYERPMDPKEFKEQCRKAYLQNAQDRKRNAELSVWGKCDWASFEKCDGPKHRR